MRIRAMLDAGGARISREYALIVDSDRIAHEQRRSCDPADMTWPTAGEGTTFELGDLPTGLRRQLCKHELWNRDVASLAAFRLSNVGAPTVVANGPFYPEPCPCHVTEQTADGFYRAVERGRADGPGSF